MGRKSGLYGLWMGILLWGSIGGAYAQISPPYSNALQEAMTKLFHMPEEMPLEDMKALADEAMEIAIAEDELGAEVDIHLYLAGIPPYAYAYEIAEVHTAQLKNLRESEPGGPLYALQTQLGYLLYFLGKNDRAIFHFSRARTGARASGDQKGLSWALNGSATVLNNSGRTSEALTHLREARNLLWSQPDEPTQVEVLNQLATMSVATGQLDSAHAYVEELLALRRKGKNQRVLVSELHHAGSLWMHQGAYVRAQQYLIEALELTSTLGDRFLQSALLVDVAEVFYQQEVWDKALQYARQGAQLAQSLQLHHIAAQTLRISAQALVHLDKPAQALEAYQAALELHETELQDPATRAQVQVEMAELLEAKADYTSAARYLEEALIPKQKLGDKLGMMDLHLSLGETYLRQNKADKALPHIAEAEGLSEDLKSLNGRAQTIQLWAEAYAQKKQFENAYAYQLRYQGLRDSLLNTEKAEIIHELETRYQAAQKDRENAELGAEVAQNQLVIEQNKRVIGEKSRQVYLLLAGIGLLILGWVFLRYRHIKRRELLQAQLLTLEKAREADTLRAVIHGEEQERQRIARELHDGLGSQLASIKLQVAAIQNDVPEVLSSPLHQQAESLLDDACHEIRTISHNLMPGSLSRYGLSQAIRDLCITMDQIENLHIDCIIDLYSPLDPAAEIALYRITQELLQNIVKHADAREVIVQLQEEENMLYLTVEDDGVGFSPQAEPKDGIGLKNLRSRVRFLQGTLDLDSRPGEGTSVYLSIPLNTQLNSPIQD